VYRCESCDFSFRLDDAPLAAPAIVAGAGGIARILTESDADLRSRRQAGIWAPLEYGCHVRDVLFAQRERVLAARWIDLPSFYPIGRDERVEFEGYAEQDPDDVSRQLRDGAALFANVLDRMPPTAWDRTVVYNYPVPRERSLRWVAARTLHEMRHHLMDIESQIAAPDGPDRGPSEREGR
jgi:hypothetical protein